MSDPNLYAALFDGADNPHKLAYRCLRGAVGDALNGADPRMALGVLRHQARHIDAAIRAVEKETTP